MTQNDEIRKLIGLAGQFAAVDEILTGRENIELVGRLYHLPKAEAKRRAAELTLDDDFPTLTGRPAEEPAAPDDAGIPAALLALVLVVGFGFAFSWISATIGLAVHDVESAQTARFVWVFPLTFTSSV